MKQLIIPVLLLAATVCYGVKPTNDDLHNINPYIFEDIINATIEGLRADLPDPLLVDGLNFTLPDDEGAVVTGNGSIANLNVTGLKQFELTALHFELIGTQINFTLVLPILDVYTDFDLDLNIANAIGIFGKGNISVNLDEVTLMASAQANLTGGISVDNVRIDLTLGNATFDLHGLFNDEDVSDLLSSILNDLAVKFIDDNQELISEVVSPIIEAVINAILGAILQPTTTPSPEEVPVGFN